MDQDLSAALNLFFKDFAPEERERLLVGEGLWERRLFQDGAVIFSEGSNSNELYLLLEGAVEIAKDLERTDHATKVLAVLTPGSLFGEGALLSDKGRIASAVARGKIETLMLTKANFDAFVESNPADASSLLLGLMKVINRRLQWTNHELVMLYDVARIVSESKDDMDGLMKSIAQKLELVTHASRGLISLENRLTELECVVAFWGDFDLTVDELEALESEVGDRDCFEKSMRLVVAIRDLSKNLLGLIVLEKEESWPSELIKMVTAIAEHVGIAIGDYKFVISEKDRSKSQEQKGRVNF